MTDAPTEYRLDRTGRPPLAFVGTFVAGAYGEDLLDERRKNPRWHDLELYRTKGGKHVLHVRYHSQWKDEVGHDEAIVLDDPTKLAEVLENWDPTAPVAGYPDTPEFAGRQARLLGEVRARFDRTVSDLFGQLGPEFAERID